jgi:hypothetical protein
MNLHRRILQDGVPIPPELCLNCSVDAVFIVVESISSVHKLLRGRQDRVCEEAVRAAKRADTAMRGMRVIIHNTLFSLSSVSSVLLVFVEVILSHGTNGSETNIECCRQQF